MIEAFGSIDPELPTDDFLAAISSADAMPAGMPRVFVEALARQEPAVTVVLDDYHADHGIPHCCDPLQLLLDDLPPSVQIVVISRADPKLPLPRRRVQGRLVEIRSQDLAFTARGDGSIPLGAHRSVRAPSQLGDHAPRSM